MHRLIGIILCGCLVSTACSSNESKEVRSDHDETQSQETFLREDSLSKAFSDIMFPPMDSLEYRTEIIFNPEEPTDSLRVQFIIKNTSNQIKKMILDTGLQSAYQGRHPLFSKLDVLNQDSSVMHLTWESLNSFAHILDDSYLKSLKESRISIAPGDSVQSEFYLSRKIKFKGGQQLPIGHYRLVIGDHAHYTDTLLFEVVSAHTK